MTSPLGAAHAVTKIPAQDLDRARRFHRDRLGLEPVEERDGGLRYVCGPTEFHIFASSAAASGRSTQLGFEVEDIDQAVADLRARGLEFESFDLGDLEVTDQIVAVPNNYPSKGTGERGAFFFDSEGNLLGARPSHPIGATTLPPRSRHRRSLPLCSVRDGFVRERPRIARIAVTLVAQADPV